MNKGLIFVVGLTAVLIIGLIVIGMYGKENDSLIVDKNPATEGAKTGSCEDNCLGDKECILSCSDSKMSAALNSDEGCTSLTSEDKTNCENLYYLNQAMTQKDSSFCEQITENSEVEGCKESVFVISGDCEKITDAETKELCLSAK